MHGSYLGVLALAGASLFMAACHVTYVGNAEAAYHDGRYLEAAEKLAKHEDEVNALPPDKQARYGMVRGMALLRLGDYDGAKRWMSYAYDREQLQSTLPPPERQQLDAAWAELRRLQATPQ